MVSPLHLYEIQQLLASNTVSPIEILEHSFEHLSDALQFGAFVTVDEAGARQAVTNLDPYHRGPLYGIPCAVKDLIDVAGMPTSKGREKSSTIAHTDSPIVRRLRDAGAIIIGKTRSDELGLGTLTPGARDPREPARSVGGSSGGSAIAVAVGAVALAIATDTAGSARIPAAACGVSGLCMAATSIERSGVVPLSPIFDRLGLIATDCLDLKVAWQAVTRSSTVAEPSIQRVCVLSPKALGQVDYERIAAMYEVANHLSKTVIELNGPPFTAFGKPRSIVITADAAAAHSFTEAESLVTRRQLEEGARYSPDTVMAARHHLAALGAELRSNIRDGILITPTLPSPPPLWDEVQDVDSQLRAIGRLTRLCAPVNSSGLVAVTLPWGFDVHDHSIAIQIIGSSEAQVLKAGIYLLDIASSKMPKV